MNMQVLDARRDSNGGYKVDVSRGERIGRVSSEWFSRPADERYARAIGSGRATLPSEPSTLAPGPRLSRLGGRRVREAQPADEQRVRVRPRVHISARLLSNWSLVQSNAALLMTRHFDEQDKPRPTESQCRGFGAVVGTEPTHKHLLHRMRHSSQEEPADVYAIARKYRT